MTTDEKTAAGQAPPDGDAETDAMAGDVAAAKSTGAPRHKRRQRRKVGYLVWLFATLLLVGGVGGGVGWVLWTTPPKPATAGRQSGSPAALELPPAPALAVALAPPEQAEAPIAAECQQTLAKVSLIAAALGPELAGLAASLGHAVAMPDQRQAGEIAPPAPYQRWEMRLLPDTSLETYARGLDFFHIELGVIGGGKEIVYLSKFSQHQPEQRTGPPRKDRRLYLTWQGSAMADQIMADRAGVSLTDKVLAQFYPPELEEQLSDLERAFAEKQGYKNVVKTIFAMKPVGAGFAFVVVDQQAGEP